MLYVSNLHDILKSVLYSLSHYIFRPLFTFVSLKHSLAWCSDLIAHLSIGSRKQYLHFDRLLNVVTFHCMHIEQISGNTLNWLYISYEWTYKQCNPDSYFMILKATKKPYCFHWCQVNKNDKDNLFPPFINGWVAVIT